MSVIKCKMCGGELNLTEGVSTAECEYCGSVQTIPNLDDEKKLVQFERAERLRKQCEFDKAAGIYETIVADFRQEAEAYWGLVLCKYGIEYVDDPATGKKVPTCHRSSFDSIMEDSDLEQVLENADPAARRVYREEAKQIEEIRKGIIAVSSNEAPYDIFICYKETAENGDRTLDSVLAQDVYDALTDKGYRVFFSRITLEDKLGMEYEPYIFAALNSAKIMLAFGTDYEYFNAVWVKNEWSRFLKLMAKDKDKHLIPCFKGIDAYDMPKEFARLQAQDMGKVGAIQDLLRGVEKLLPRQTEVKTVVQERVVVGGSGDNKIASLLDRGNMALEDGDWDKADSFFEDVLNNDSKNAQAYLGKTLAQERCRTIDAFVRKRKERSLKVSGSTLSLSADNVHINAMAEKYSIPGYVSQEEIRKLYTFTLSYHSDVSERQQQYKDEENYWKNHKLLSRAEQFAVGAVAENLQREKKALFAALTDRVKKAMEAADAERKNVQERYAAHIKEADEKAEKVYNAGVASRDAHYQKLVKTAQETTYVTQLESTAKQLDQLGDYLESKKFAEHCRKRAAEEQAKIDAEKALKAQRAREATQKRLAILKKGARIIAAAVAILAVVLFVVSTFVMPAVRYSQAVSLMEGKHYAEAAMVFESLGNHRDSQEQAVAAKYAYGEAILAAENYLEAFYVFEALGEYQDAPKRCLAAKTAIYDEVIAFLDAEDYHKAIEAIDRAKGVIDTFPDVEKSKKYAEAMILLQDGEYEKAKDGFSTLGGFRNSGDMLNEASNEISYNEAKKLLKEENYEEATRIFFSLGDFKDSDQYLQQAGGVLYDNALGKYLAGEPVYLEQTLTELEKLPSEFRDVEKYKKEISSLVHKYDGRYYRYVGSKYLDSCEFTFNGEEYHFYYTWGVNTYNYDKYNLKIMWAVKNGKVVYGEARTYTDMLKFTPTSKGMKVTSKDDSRYVGSYTKKK